MNIKEGLKRIENFKFFDKLDFVEKLFEEKTRIGLDIGSHSVKFVQLKEGPGGASVVNLGYKQLPKDLIKTADGAAREDFIVQALRGLWQEQKIKTKSVRLVVSDPAIYLRRISVPKVAKEELTKAIKWQAEKYISFSIEDAIVEFQTLGLNLKENQNQMDIIIVAAKRETVNKYIGMLASARLIPVILDICPFAAAKACFKNYAIGQEAATAVIDLGASVTSIVVLKGDSLQFVRTIDLGAAEPLLADLAKEIDRSLAYCEAELFIQKMDRIILCGGGARLEGLDKFLAEKTGLPVEIGNPFKNIAVDPALLRASNTEQIAPNLMAALGAALS